MPLDLLQVEVSGCKLHQPPREGLRLPKKITLTVVRKQVPTAKPRDRVVKP